MYIIGCFIQMEMDRNRVEFRVFARLHGDHPSSQPMIWQRKDKLIIMCLSSQIPTKCCTNKHVFARVNECMKKTTSHTELLYVGRFFKKKHLIISDL